MKTAVSKEKIEIEASEEAPQKAFCPQCDHPVQLRKRKLMNDRGYVYFWRHTSGGSLDCKERSIAMRRSSSTTATKK